MPIVRKIIQIGSARGITLPKAWLEWLSREYGEIKLVLLEIDHELRVRPYIPKDARREMAKELLSEG